ncbi:MAG: hypothetical protein ACRDLP_11105 [Solirubrobacteraceae bacterium]
MNQFSSPDRDRRDAVRSAQASRGRWGRRQRSRVAPAVDQELEVRSRLYAKPPPTERTVEVLGPARRVEDRPAA